MIIRVNDVIPSIKEGITVIAVIKASTCRLKEYWILPSLDVLPDRAGIPRAPKSCDVAILGNKQNNIMISTKLRIFVSNPETASSAQNFGLSTSKFAAIHSNDYFGIF